MAITTSPVTMRVNTKVLSLVKADAKKTDKGYQTVINEKLAKSYGVVIPPVVRTAKPLKPVAAKTKAAPLKVKAKPVKKVSAKPLKVKAKPAKAKSKPKAKKK